jgi:tRNA 2-thiouridine synthesizing protein A
MHDDPELDDGDLDDRTAALQVQVERITGGACRRCGTLLCGHAAVLSIVFGCRPAPRCASCLAAEHGEDQPSLLRRALEWIRRRDCYLHVWRRAGEREGAGAVDEPRCLSFGAAEPAAPTPGAVSPATADARFDAGDLACGDLVLELRLRLRELPPGAVLHVTAQDPAAPIDLPAWCGVCGHTLRYAAHPDYWIERRAKP